MSNKLIPTELPDSHVDFAKEVAEAAKKHGIEKFTLKYRPEFDINNTELAYWGTLTVNFSSSDSRGRPANILKISYESKLEHVVVATQESCS